jgi:phasin family protein
MIDKQFDPAAVMAATREAFAPVLKAQQEGFKTFERLARLQYALAGDVLESGLARMHATFGASSPTDLLSKQTELSNELAEKLRARAEEFATVTSEVQAKFSQLGSEMTAKTVRSRKAA